MRLDLHTACPSAPSRLLPRGSLPTGEPTPARRSNARTKPGGSARRRTRTVWRPRPPWASHDHSPLREGRGGFQVCTGPRGSGPRAAPHPPQGRGGPATPTARAHRRRVRRRHEGGQDGEPRAATQRGSREAAARPPPPTPPTGPQAAGSRPPPPEAGGMVPPPPAPERSRSAARPPAPAAGSHRNRREQASPRQRARTPHRSCPAKAGEHEPQWYGGPRPPWTERRQ